MLAEIQALIALTIWHSAKIRNWLRWNRLAMILAVLEARCNISLSNKDIFLNVVVAQNQRTSCGSCSCRSAPSSLFNLPTPQESIIFGEIGLSAEIRTVNYSDIRLKEGFKLGFTKAIISPLNQ